jgi:hypothetical protein
MIGQLEIKWCSECLANLYEGEGVHDYGVDYCETCFKELCNAEEALNGP